MASTPHGHLAWDCASLLVVAILSIPCTDATASDFFGPSNGLQIQPELDVFERLNDDFRLIQRLLPTFIPSQAYSEMGLGVYIGWFVAPVTTHTISPDLTHRRRLDVRLGVEWYPSLEEGTALASNILLVVLEGTPRLVAPSEILFTVRNRVEARWQLASPRRLPGGCGSVPSWNESSTCRTPSRSRRSRTPSGSGRPPATCGTSFASRSGCNWACTGSARAR